MTHSKKVLLMLLGVALLLATVTVYAIGWAVTLYPDWWVWVKSSDRAGSILCGILASALWFAVLVSYFEDWLVDWFMKRAQHKREYLKSLKAKEEGCKCKSYCGSSYC